MLFVDTHVVASLFIDGPFTVQARELQADPHWRSESFPIVELTHVITTQVRAERFALVHGQQVLRDALLFLQGRLVDLVEIEHASALACATRHRVSAYDARFVQGAETLGLRLITEDARLSRAAPALTHSLAEALGQAA